jgi:hypothetical protein
MVSGLCDCVGLCKPAMVNDVGKTGYLKIIGGALIEFTQAGIKFTHLFI